jgi:excinuclease ABC subunit C
MIDLKSIPIDPGCYLYKDMNGDIIYIGKAKNLQKRIQSYFLTNNHDEKTRQLVKKIVDVEFIATDNEIEALLLESNLIKKHRPKYNINLKDSKRYAYIKITDEDFPRVVLARKKEEKELIFGPFVSAEKRDMILKLINETFKLRTCKRLPKKSCLRYHIGLCDAPCIDKISKKDYNDSIYLAKKVLQGKTVRLIADLNDKMLVESENLNFEKALQYRDKIHSLKVLAERQKVDNNKRYDEDIINYKIKDDKVYLMIFNIYKGTLENKQEFLFDNVGNFDDQSADFFPEFILHYYSDEQNKIPKEIIIPVKLDAKISKALSKQRGNKVSIRVPKTGEKKELLDLVKKNIDLVFFKGDRHVDSLQEHLRLNLRPDIIECFDISHLSGTNMVASMVQFKDGMPNKSEYRRFKIKSVEGIDDFKAIYEVVYRRYRRLKDEEKNMPDLIVIDGGKGQLSFASKALKKLRLKIAVISIAKRQEEIFTLDSNNPLIFDKKNKALLLLQKIRDEAHRFAITYNRLLRKKSLIKR